MNEILEQLPRLAPAEREQPWRRLEELELTQIQESPEMLAAIDAGRRSIQAGQTLTIEATRERLRQWTSKS